jgi:hypothetical protein
MKKTIMITAIVLILYGLAGLNERGWFDWLGLVTVGLLVAPIARIYTVMERSDDDGTAR